MIIAGKKISSNKNVFYERAFMKKLNKAQIEEIKNRARLLYEDLSERIGDEISDMLHEAEEMDVMALALALENAVCKEIKELL